MKKLDADATLDERVENLYRRMQRINPRKNAPDTKAAIRSAFAHLIGSLTLRDDHHASRGSAQRVNSLGRCIPWKGTKR
jgi:hypothetical protein